MSRGSFSEGPNGKVIDVNLFPLWLKSPGVWNKQRQNMDETTTKTLSRKLAMSVDSSNDSGYGW